MNRNYQLIPFKLTGKTYDAGNNFSIPLDQLPVRGVDGRPLALVKVILEATLTPSFTTAPTVIGQNNIVKQLSFNDGRATRFNYPGGFNDVRFFERLENGRLPYADAPTNNGTGNPIYFKRVITMGPPRMAGSPGDFMVACSALKGGSIDGVWGALADLSADATAATGSIAAIAMLAYVDDIPVAPFYERKRQAISNDQLISGPAAYAFLGLANSTALDAFASNDLGDVSVSVGSGALFSGIAAELLAHAYNEDFAAGAIGGLVGEPRNATYDVAARIVNLGTPTALMAQAFDLQPILWVPPGCRMSKIVARTKSNLQISTSGSQASGTVAYLGRFLEQGSEQLAEIARESASGLGVTLGAGSFKPATLSKAPLRNAVNAGIMPFKGKLR